MQVEKGFRAPKEPAPFGVQKGLREIFFLKEVKEDAKRIGRDPWYQVVESSSA